MAEGRANAFTDKVVRGDCSAEATLDKRYEGGEGLRQMGIRGKNIPDRRKSKCKDSEAGACFLI